MTKPTRLSTRDRLLAEHARLETLFEHLLDAFAADAREDTQAYWTELEAGLERHFAAEEQLYFPKFEQVDAAETRALRAEHDRIRRQLAELGAGVDLKLVRDDVARAFIEALRAHAKREDELLYRRLR